MAYEKDWQETYGIDRDPVREFLIYPLLFKELGHLEAETLVDLGCGNGGLIYRLSNLQFKKAVGVDVSEAFLGHAKLLCNDERISFYKQDLSTTSSLNLEPFDKIVSVFVINELEDLHLFFSNVRSLLKHTGTCHLILTHPFLVLKEALQERYLNVPSTKLVGDLNYKSKSKLDYIFTIIQAKANYYQHTFEDLLLNLKSNDLQIESLIELTTSAPEFEATPYWPERDIPKYLYLKCRAI